VRHALEEVGHDQWALHDLSTLGEDVTRLPFENPLQQTLALVAFTFYQLDYRNPIGHIGYIYFLEFLPTAYGHLYVQAIERIGVPRSAMTFLLEHVSVDVDHNELMALYVDKLVHTDADVEAVKYAMRVTAKLYADLMQAAIEQAENRRDWGTAYQELG
jgi:hypothetical protein